MVASLGSKVNHSHVEAGQIFDGGDQAPSGLLEDWFSDRYGDLEIEVGCSHGNFLCRIARANPFTKFIGIDVNADRCYRAAMRIVSFNLPNACVVNSEAHGFFLNRVPSNFISGVHIYFPTPYPKSIGLSDRLLSVDFLEEVYRTLRPGGTLRIATDLVGYFNYICDNLRFRDWWKIEWRPPVSDLTDKNLIVGTPCEFKYREKSEILEIQVMK